MKRALPLSLLALALSAFAPSAGACPHPAPVRDAEVVEVFDAAALEAPESIAIDASGNMFLSMALTGEIRKIDPDGESSTVAVLPLGAPPLTPCGSFIGIMGALALDHQDNLYVSLASCNASDRGIWKITPEGDASLLAGLPPMALPNGIVVHGGQVYVADSELGVLWRAPANGSGPAEIWVDHPLLHPSVGHVFPGPNGLQLFHDELYVANSDQMSIVAVKLKKNGKAGAVRVHAAGVPCDDFAFDVQGNLYATTDPFNTLLRVAPDGTSEVLLTADDGLDGPTSVAFGQEHGDRENLYINNAAFPFFSVTHDPKMVRLDVGVRGALRR